MSARKQARVVDKHVMAEVCKLLKKTNAIDFGAFKLSNGRLTPYYIDLRVIPSFPDAFRMVSDIFVDTVKQELGTEKFDRVSSIPAAGTPFASLLAFRLDKPFIFTRRNVRLRGRARQVEGVLIPGDRVLLVDDLATTGLSLKRAASAIRTEGGVVSDAFVLLDREEGGRERLAKNGIALHSVLKMTETAEALYEINAIDEEQLNTIQKQIKAR